MTFLSIQKFQRILLMGRIILAEDHVHQIAVLVDDGQRIDLMVPDDIVGLLQGNVIRADDHFRNRGHEGTDRIRHLHPAYPVVTARHDAFEMAMGRPVTRDGHRGMARLFLQFQHICQSAVGAQVGIADHETGLVALDAGNHGRFALDALRTVDEGKSAFTGQGNGHFIIRNGLHDG